MIATDVLEQTLFAECKIEWSGTMTRMFVRHEVADYDAWRAAYDSVDETRKKMGCIAQSVYHAPDNPHDITVIHDFLSLDAARAFASSSVLKETMTKAGVIKGSELWFAEAAN